MSGSEGRSGLLRRQLLTSGPALVPAALAAAPQDAVAADVGRRNSARGGIGGGRSSPMNGVPPGRAFATPLSTHPAQWSAIAKVFGRPGELIRGLYYHTAFPRWDLPVTSHGVRITPALAVASHASFATYSDGKTLLMGDLVVRESEMQRLTDDLQAAGIMLTAVHKHLLAHTPELWWVHVCAVGHGPTSMARGLRAALDSTGTPPPIPYAYEAGTDFDPSRLDAVLGARGTVRGGVYSAAFVRREPIVEDRRLLPPGLGSTTAFNFQPLGGTRAAVSADFAMVATEVQDVLKALRHGGVDLVSLHNHGLTDEPRLFFAHVWAVGDDAELAVTLRRAVALTDAAPPSR
jgi:hypothetical protein